MEICNYTHSCPDDDDDDDGYDDDVRSKKFGVKRKKWSIKDFIYCTSGNMDTQRVHH